MHRFFTTSSMTLPSNEPTSVLKKSESFQNILLCFSSEIPIQLWLLIFFGPSCGTHKVMDSFRIRNSRGELPTSTASTVRPFNRAKWGHSIKIATLSRHGQKMTGKSASFGQIKPMNVTAVNGLLGHFSAYTTFIFK